MNKADVLLDGRALVRRLHIARSSSQARKFKRGVRCAKFNTPPRMLARTLCSLATATLNKKIKSFSIVMFQLKRRVVFVLQHLLSVVFAHEHFVHRLARNRSSCPSLCSQPNTLFIVVFVAAHQIVEKKSRDQRRMLMKEQITRNFNKLFDDLRT